MDRYIHTAETYEKHRPDFSAKISDTVFEITQLSREITVADIASGTGKLTQHFADKVKTIFAVEPSDVMRAIAEKKLGQHPSFHSINGNSTATTLPDHSIDLIMEARALQWFPPELTKLEFNRVLKPNGWLVLVDDFHKSAPVYQRIKQLKTPEYGWGYSLPDEISEAKLGLSETSVKGLLSHKSERFYTPVSFYYGHENYTLLSLPHSIHLDWQGFLNFLASFPSKPHLEHPLYNKFESFAREIFDELSVDRILTIPVDTNIWIGQVKR